MRPMNTLQDLIEEAKVRTVWWVICVFAITYFLSHTSKSMWTNIPLSILMLSVFRYLSYNVEFRWRVQPTRKLTYLSHLGKSQLSVNDYRLSTVPPTSRWRRKIDSPSVEAAVEDFINKILQDFVVDLWYSSISPDKEAPELIRALIFDVLGEISARVKEVNLVDLLTRDMVDLIANQLELYRRNQSEIGIKVMATLSFEERDERLKRHLIASKELHPALLSAESEHKVLQRIVGGILAVVLKPQEAQCPLARCFGRELLTCLVLQPVMNLACPGYINELIEYILLANKDDSSRDTNPDRSSNAAGLAHNHSVQGCQPEQIVTISSPSSDLTVTKSSGEKILSSYRHGNLETVKDLSEIHSQPRPADWATAFEAVNKRRSEVLAPENLENMWTKGRNYKKKNAKLPKAGLLKSPYRGVDDIVHTGATGKELSTSLNERITRIDDKYMVNLMHGSDNNTQSKQVADKRPHDSIDVIAGKSTGQAYLFDDGRESSSKISKINKGQLKRSNSTPDIDTTFTRRSGETIATQENANLIKHKEEDISVFASHSEGSLHIPKIRCRVVGAYFEKIGSTSFAVYSIAVTDVTNADETWFVKRRYRNFERLHRQLKEIPNYSLHLPPKRFLSSSIDDYFVHQRCILLDKYLQDLLSIPNVAEQHEVWDFLSASSKNYSFGKSTSVMKTLAVNVDDAMDDIVRQFKGVSDGLKRKVVGSSPSQLASSSSGERNLALSWNGEELNKHSPVFSTIGTSHSLSDDESHYDDRPLAVDNGWHSDNELNSKEFPPRIVKHIEESSSLESQRSQQLDKFDKTGFDAPKTIFSLGSNEDPAGMPPEWAPPNVSVPLLNLVDKIFQLKRRGWLRRQVFWISKQILQLMMEDAIDDWILRHIHWLRRDDIIAKGIRWIQDVLWPNGTFFTRLESFQGRAEENRFSENPAQSANIYDEKASRSSSFELQLEASRRARDVKKMLLDGAPTTLVSLIGHNQYQRCAKDIYYFLQSTVCVKQLAYTTLELVLVSVFPELRELIIDIHEKAHTRSV